jgi:hypothetical protein
VDEDKKADSQIEEYHPNSFIPIKSSKKHQLSGKEKAYIGSLRGGG